MIRYTVDFDSEAVADLEEIQYGIAVDLDNPISADKIINKIIDYCYQLSIFPKRGEIKDVFNGDEIRFAHVGRYTIVYLINDKEKTVHIYMILYSRMDIMSRIYKRYKG